MTGYDWSYEAVSMFTITDLDTPNDRFMIHQHHRHSICWAVGRSLTVCLLLLSPSCPPTPAILLSLSCSLTLAPLKLKANGKCQCVWGGGIGSGLAWTGAGGLWWQREVTWCVWVQSWLVSSSCRMIVQVPNRTLSNQFPDPVQVWKRTTSSAYHCLSIHPPPFADKADCDHWLLQQFWVAMGVGLAGRGQQGMSGGPP